jgi:hypothetical protein
MSDLYASWQAAIATLISTVGVPATFTPSGGAGQSVTVAVAKPKDETVINDYGQESRMVTIPADGITGTPAVVDGITVNGNVYKIAAVSPINVRSQVVAYRCVVQG